MQPWQSLSLALYLEWTSELYRQKRFQNALRRSACTSLAAILAQTAFPKSQIKTRKQNLLEKKTRGC